MTPAGRIVDEDSLIRKIIDLFGPGSVRLGIGDDAAILDTSGPMVITTDMLVEDVDFTTAIPPCFIGQKSLAVNLSDLAAMGSRPTAFLLTIGLPQKAIGAFDELIRGIASTARKYGVGLIGGDLSSAEKLVISITVMGELTAGRALTRRGATAGDHLYVSRPLGASSAGLALLGLGWSIALDGSVKLPPNRPGSPGYEQREFAAAVLFRHVSPEPEIDLGARLVEESLATSCIDISDGLSRDLHRLCASSGVGAEIERERVPAFADLERHGPKFGLDVESAVLQGGEEYALLFTSPLREAELSRRVGRPVYAIGRITAAAGVVLTREGKAEALPALGFDHFG